ncbi:helix-turn-helix domain containing protein [Iamia majanohamensis]|uniref:Helix-turn-helix domain containing protein n=1 Tax=Iamia majanohamensis TaxID=467976 RepID=A0AAE9YBN1_9ACTN|nr:TetR/AcrR family transcriptional regulator [Iamia majanohamensis]WCO68054.1 helix-turn-helix domain containing protein [Iamia majanohamensis]
MPPTPGDAPRAYTSPARAEGAAATRRRIVDAAASLFSERGYQGTTLQAIADAAGVSVQSVHLAGPKGALLMAAFETTFAGDEGTHPLAERPALVEIVAIVDSSEALDRYVELIAHANERSAGIWDALRTAAQTEEAIARSLADLATRRAGDLGTGAAWLEQRRLLEPQADLSQVADVLGLITGPDTYRHFVVDRVWPLERYQRWMRHAIDRLLLAQDGPDRRDD